MAQRQLRRALTAAALAAVFVTAAAAAEGKPAPPAQSFVQTLVTQVWQWMGGALEEVLPSAQRPPFPDAAPENLPEQCPVCDEDKGGGIDPNG